MECAGEILLRIQDRANPKLERARFQAERDIGVTATGLILEMLDAFMEVDPYCDWSQTEAVAIPNTDAARWRSKVLLDATDGLHLGLLKANCPMDDIAQQKYGYWFRVFARARASTES